MAAAMPESTLQDEAALQGFLADVAGPEGVAIRTLAHAWQGGGGGIQVGTVAVRLTAGKPDGPFTAATLHAPRGGQGARLELCRVLLERHGVRPDAWVHWSDEFADLAHHGFDAAAKYPTLPLAPLSATELARLVTGLRDLARLVA